MYCKIIYIYKNMIVITEFMNISFVNISMQHLEYKVYIYRYIHFGDILRNFYKKPVT